MSEKLNIKINFGALQVRKTKMKGKDGEIDVLILPIKENGIFEGDNNLFAMEFIAFQLNEPKKFEKITNTHLVKQSLPKEIYEKMSDEDKKKQPIAGNIYYWNSQGESQGSTVSEIKADEELPW